MKIWSLVGYTRIYKRAFHSANDVAKQNMHTTKGVVGSTKIVRSAHSVIEVRCHIVATMFENFIRKHAVSVFLVKRIRTIQRVHAQVKYPVM
jgi:hypothetical protein